MTELCGPKEYLMIIGVLFGVIIAISAGKGIGRLGLAILKKYFGKEAVAIHIDQAALNPSQAAALSCLINPENCPKHEAENQRSLQNKEDIKALKDEFYSYRTIFFKEIKATRNGVTCIINGLLAKQIISPHDLPKEDL